MMEFVTTSTAVAGKLLLSGACRPIEVRLHTKITWHRKSECIRFDCFGITRDVFLSCHELVFVATQVNLKHTVDIVLPSYLIRTVFLSMTSIKVFCDEHC